MKISQNKCFLFSLNSVFVENNSAYQMLEWKKKIPISHRLWLEMKIMWNISKNKYIIRNQYLQKQNVDSYRRHGFLLVLFSVLNMNRNAWHSVSYTHSPLCSWGPLVWIFTFGKDPNVRLVILSWTAYIFKVHFWELYWITRFPF